MFNLETRDYPIRVHYIYTYIYICIYIYRNIDIYV